MRRALYGVFPLVLIVAVTGCSRNPERAKQEYLKSGNRYYQQKKYAEAIVQYRNAVQQDARFGEARYRLSEAYEQVGDAPGAFREAVRAADLLPQRVDAQLKAAAFLLLARQFEDAKTRAERALALEPNNPRAQIVRGNALAGLSDFEAAIKQLQEAITIEPSMGAYLSLGVVQITRGDRPEAEAAFRRAVDVAPKDPTPHLALANYLWSAGRASEAESSLKAALALDPKNLVANNALATFYIASRRAPEAQPYLEELAQLDTSPQGGAKLALADFYVALDQREKALAVLEKVAGTKEGFAPARTRIAVLQYTAHLTTEAHRTIDEVLAKQPKFARALVAKAWFLAQEKKYTEALAGAQAAAAADASSAQAQYLIGMLQLARRKPTEATEAFNQVLRLNPRAVAAQLRLAELYLAGGQKDTALQLAESAARALPTDPGTQLILARTLIAKRDLVHADAVVKQLVTNNPELSAAHVAAGNLAGAREDKLAARRSFARALDLEPGNLEALTNMTALDLQDRRAVEATNRLDVRLARAPRDSGLLMLAARLHATLGERDQAERLLRTAIDADPAALPAYGLLGQLYIHEGRLADAHRMYDAIVAQQPKSVAAHTMVALLYEMDHNTTEARRRYEKVLDIDPHAAVAANNLAWIYADEGGNLDLALQLAQTAKQRLPDAPEVNDTLGWIYYKKNLTTLALRPLEDAAAAQPKNAVFHYHLAMAYMKAGDKTKARRAVDRALTLQPEMREAKDVRTALATQ